MNDKDALELLEKVMTDNQPVVFSMATREVYLLISYLQVAYRFPGMSKVMRGHIRHIADQVQLAVIENYPEIEEVLQKGWDTQFDREQGSISASEREWIEGRNLGRKK